VSVPFSGEWDWGLFILLLSAVLPSALPTLALEEEQEVRSESVRELLRFLASSSPPEPPPFFLVGVCGNLERAEEVAASFTAVAVDVMDELLLGVLEACCRRGSTWGGYVAEAGDGLLPRFFFFPLIFTGASDEDWPLDGAEWSPFGDGSTSAMLLCDRG